MTWITIIIIIVMIWLYLNWLKKQPKIHKKISQEELKYYFELLFKRGHDGAFISIYDETKKWFVQFEKRFIENQKRMILDFPVAPWSEDYIIEFEKIMRAHNFQFDKHTLSKEEGYTEGGVVATYSVDVGDSIETAVKLTCIVIQNVFKLPPTHLIDLHLVKLSVIDKIVKI